MWNSADADDSGGSIRVPRGQCVEERRPVRVAYENGPLDSGRVQHRDDICDVFILPVRRRRGGMPAAAVAAMIQHDVTARGERVHVPAACHMFPSPAAPV
jgi:hypothetical protein